MRKKYKLRRRVGRTVSTVFKVVFTMIFLFPFYWMIITSLKTYLESTKYPPTLWPLSPTIEAYVKIFQEMDLWPYLRNSLVIVIFTLLLQTAIMIPAAYAFARYKFKGNGLMFGIVTMAFMVPTQVTFVSVYIMFARAGLLRTLLPQILPHGANAWGIFLLRQNFKQVPEELIEAARLDEAGELRIMTRIMLPMAKPAYVTVMLMSFIGTWNSYFWPLVMCVSEDTKPFTLAISKFRELETGMAWPTVMAGNLLLMLPVLILFLIGSKRIISGIAYRGAK